MCRKVLSAALAAALLMQPIAAGQTVYLRDGSPPAKTGDMPFKLETAHYVVKTDVSATVCKNVGRAMEHLYAAYTRIFHPAKKLPKKADVILFDNKDDFAKYAKTRAPSPAKTPSGYYSVRRDGTNEIVTYKRKTGEFHTMSTLYHEATHQFITMVMGVSNPPPLWLNEGLAVYFENSRWEKGKFRTGIIPRTRLLLVQNALKANKYVHLADLVKRRRDTYDALCYSEGWALVYFFAKAGHGAYRKRFSQYILTLKEGKDPDKAFRVCFTKDTDKLEAAWKKFVLALEVPPK